MAIQIAKLTPKYIKQTHELLHKIIRHHKCYSEHACKYWEHFYTPAKLRGDLNDAQWIMLIAKDNNNVVGFTNVYKIMGGVAQCDWCIVNPNYSGHGIGHALTKALFKECRKAGCHKIETDSRINNAAGISLLKATGWQKVSLLKRHWFGQDYFLWEKFL
ncbi:MAG: GNAT family N-acetyltransferase [DPANN group archaeon]|nr:GNAT family N-acetyltransferase [DPANN group archaeon]